jgi:hypothetical protein
MSVHAHRDYRIYDALRPDLPNRFAHRRIQLGLEAEITAINQWGGLMPNRIDSHRIGARMPVGFTALCAMLAVVALPNGSTRAANDCAAAPTSQPPEGSHWYYRIEGAKQRHCWYLGPEGQRVRHAEPAAKSVAPVRTETDGDRRMASAQVEPPLPPLRPKTATDANAQAFVRDIEQRSVQETFSIAQQPDALSPSGASERAPTDTNTRQEVNSENKVARPAAAVAANAGTTMLMRVLLLVGGALTIAGIFQHAIFRAVVARRRQISAVRGRPGPSGNLARERMPAAFGELRPKGRERSAAEEIDPRDIEAGFRQILRAVERRAA